MFRAVIDNYIDETSGNYAFTDGNKRLKLWGKDDFGFKKKREGKAVIVNPHDFNVEVRSQDVSLKGSDSWGKWRNATLGPKQFLTFRGPKKSGKDLSKNSLSVEVHRPQTSKEKAKINAKTPDSRSATAELKRDIADAATKVGGNLVGAVKWIVILAVVGFGIMFGVIKMKAMNESKVTTDDKQ